MLPRTLIPLGLVLLAASAGARAAPEALPTLDAGTSLLVVSPHPDDETLCCAGVIQRVLGAGGRVSIVWVTSGDGSALGMLLVEKTLFDAAKMRAYGEERMQEARTATAALGVPAAGQLFLGYPDGGLLELLGEYRTHPYASRYTRTTTVPYADALFPGHPYTGESLAQDLQSVIERVRPTLVLAPSPLDGHDDHRAAGLAMQSLSARTHAQYTMRYWIVHGGEGWPSPRGLLRGVPLVPAPRAAPLHPLPFALLPAEEDRKLAAVRAYRTQLQVMEPFLLSFVRSTELFSVRATGP
ncbi:MAG: PIG-L family deacetylase [Proteobacteria bacterium]|nr:PIG-L family deacetylase [Pseudomonadota bacterium]